MKQVLPRPRVLCLAAVAALGACVSSSDPFPGRERSADDMEDAASVHVAVLSVAPWEDVVSALQPEFELNAKDALALSLPTTRRAEETFVDALRAALGVKVLEPEERAPPPAGSESGDGQAAAKADEPRERVEVSAPKSDQPFAPGAGAARSAGTAALEQDPLLAYATASALYQEVQLLNRTLTDAAIRTGHRAYVVRLQVSLLPRARNLPYDAFCNIGFFSADAPEAPGFVPRSDPGGAAEADPAAARPRAGPQVVPLLVTDSLEMTQRSRALARIRDAIASASYAAELLGVSGSTQHRAEDARALVGQDANGLFTVGRLSDNALRVRIGAAQQSETDFALLPRTHNVTLLVTAPEGSPASIQVVAKTSLVDTRTGEALPGRTLGDVERALARVAEDHGLVGAGPELLWQLSEAAQRNDRAAFDEALGGRRDTHAEALWIDLVSVLAGSQYSTTAFDLPVRGRSPSTNVAFPPQTALLADDCADAAVATLVGGSGVAARDLSATLVVDVGGTQHRLSARRVRVARERGSVQFEFPSPEAWGIVRRGDPAGSARLTLVVALSRLPVEYPVVYARRGGGD